LSSDNEEYLKPNIVAETTARQRDPIARVLTSSKLYFNCPPKSTKNCRQIYPTVNDYHSDPMEITSTCWFLDITDWWRQQEEMRSKNTALSNVGRDVFSIIPYGVGLEASFSLG